MSPSPREIGAIVIGLVGGYWLVSRAMRGRNAPDRKSENFGGGPEARPGQEQPHGDPPRDAPRPWWVVLGVPQIATRDEVVHAYKRKISAYHPDKVVQMGDEIRALAEHHAKEINSAYEEAMRRS